MVSRSQANAKPNSASGNRIHTNKSKDLFHITSRLLFQTVSKHFREHRKLIQLPLCKSFPSQPRNKVNSSVSRDFSTKLEVHGGKKTDLNNHSTRISTHLIMGKEMGVPKLKCTSHPLWTQLTEEGRWLVAHIQSRSLMGRWPLLVHRKCSLVSAHLRQEAQGTRFSRQVALIITDRQLLGTMLSIHCTKVHNLPSHPKNKSRILKPLRYLGPDQTLQSSTPQDR